MLSHFSHVQLLVTLWTVARQAPLSMVFSRQEHRSGLPFPSPTYLVASLASWGEFRLGTCSREGKLWRPSLVPPGTSLVLLLSQIWAPHTSSSLGGGSSPGCGPLAAGTSVLCTPTPTHAHACVHAHPHTHFSPSSSLSLSPPFSLPLAGVGGRYTFSFHRTWAVAQGRAGPWWTLLNGSQEQVGGLLTAGTEGGKGASEEGAGLLLLPAPLFAFLHQPLHHTRVSSHSEKGRF